jgi:hypothetical protein
VHHPSWRRPDGLRSRRAGPKVRAALVLAHACALPAHSASPARLSYSRPPRIPHFHSTRAACASPTRRATCSPRAAFPCALSYSRPPRGRLFHSICTLRRWLPARLRASPPPRQSPLASPSLTHSTRTPRVADDEPSTTQLTPIFCDDTRTFAYCDLKWRTGTLQPTPMPAHACTRTRPPARSHPPGAGAVEMIDQTLFIHVGPCF